MYDWQKVEPKLDSTLRLIHEAATRGHRVSIIHSNEMAIRRTIVWSTCHILTNINIPEDMAEFYDEATFKKELLPLKEHDALELMEKRLSQGNIKQFIEDNPDSAPPGLQATSEYTVSVRKNKEYKESE